MDDWEPFAAFFESDASAYVGGPLPRRRSWFGFAADVGSWDLLGFGAWALDDTASGAFVGQVALEQAAALPRARDRLDRLPALPAPRLRPEAARAARAYAYGTLGWTTAVSYIDRDNAASIAIARKLGCVEDPAAGRFDDEDIVFRHPAPEPPREALQ